MHSRQATIKDLPKLVSIFDDYRTYFNQKPNPEQVEKFLFEKFEHLESVIFVAELQDEIIGFAQIYPTFSSLTLQRVWLLNDFFISKKSRGIGAGKQLFATVKEFAILTKAKGIELSVEHINQSAWDFWERRGFKLDKEFRYYFHKL